MKQPIERLSCFEPVEQSLLGEFGSFAAKKGHDERSESPSINSLGVTLVDPVPRIALSRFHAFSNFSKTRTSFEQRPDFAKATSRQASLGSLFGGFDCVFGEFGELIVMFSGVFKTHVDEFF